MNKTAISWAHATWYPVEGHPGYAVNVEGKIRGPSGLVLKPLPKASGHLFVTIGPRHGRRNLMIHLAVLYTFRGVPPHGMEGRHLDGDATNNRLSNLMWGTRIEQREDDRRHGVVRRPKNLILDQVNAGIIRRMHGHAPSREVGIAFGVSHTTVQKIWRGERWVQKL